MRCTLGLLVLLGLGQTLAAQTEQEIRQALTTPILKQGEALAEVQKFVEPRIARLGEYKDAAAWMQEAQRLRAAVLAQVVLRGAAKGWYDARGQVEWQATLPGGEGYQLKQVRYEALPGLWIPALLYEPLKLGARKVPVALHVMGHDGGGKDVGYQQLRSINLAKRGILVLNIEWFAFGQLAGADNSHGRLNQLDLCGTSGVAPFYLALKRGLDVLLSHPSADAKRVAVSGLSGGGWQTIFISSLDERVTLANPVAGYSSFLTRSRHFSDLGDSEQTPCDLGGVADYKHLTAMLAPRGALLTYNSKDNCCFASGHALPPLVEAALPIYRLLGKTASLRSHVNDVPGTHNYEQDNREAYYAMIGEQLFPGDTTYPRKEIECAREVRKAVELRVPMPAKNETLHSLALALSKDLPRVKEVANAAALRTQLRQTIRLHDWKVKATAVATAKLGNVTVTAWQLKLDDVWTVPAVELAPADAKGTTIVLHDGGRVKTEQTVAALLKQGQRVVALDPLFIGDTRMPSHEYLWQLMIGTVGERPIGVQVGQISAVARWVFARQKQDIVLHASGPRTSMQALLAAALEPAALNGVQTNGGLASLREVIARNYSYEQAPELFCFGLLEVIDVPQLLALIQQRGVGQ